MAGDWRVRGGPLAGALVVWSAVVVRRHLLRPVGGHDWGAGRGYPYGECRDEANGSERAYVCQVSFPSLERISPLCGGDCDNSEWPLFFNSATVNCHFFNGDVRLVCGSQNRPRQPVILRTLSRCVCVCVFSSHQFALLFSG